MGFLSCLIRLLSCLIVSSPRLIAKFLVFWGLGACPQYGRVSETNPYPGCGTWSAAEGKPCSRGERCSRCSRPHIASLWSAFFLSFAFLYYTEILSKYGGFEPLSYGFVVPCTDPYEKGFRIVCILLAALAYLSRSKSIEIAGNRKRKSKRFMVKEQEIYGQKARDLWFCTIYCASSIFIPCTMP